MLKYDWHCCDLLCVLLERGGGNFSHLLNAMWLVGKIIKVDTHTHIDSHQTLLKEDMVVYVRHKEGHP